MSTLSHPIKAEHITWLNMGWAARAEHDIQLHKTGCKHLAKAQESRDYAPGEEPSPDDIYVDDWYYVAPCARRA